MRPREIFVRYRSEVIVFTIGVLLFSGGLINVIASNRSTQDEEVDLRPSAPGPSGLGEVGPGAGTDLVAYIDGKKKLLASRAKAAPKEASFAVLSFDSYKTPDETDKFVKARKLETNSVEVRIPLPGYSSDSLSLENLSVVEAISAWRDRRLSTLREELSELEKIIPTVDDKEFRRVYQEDAESRRKAISILEGNASVVFGLLVRGPHGDLLKASQAPGVRLVDLPEEPATTPETHRFKALTPE